MVNEYTLYVWESQMNGSSYFCYDLLNNETKRIELGSGCTDPYMLSEDIKKEKLYPGLEDVSVKYIGEPSPMSDLPSCDVELSQKIRGYLERALDIDINYYSLMH